MPLFLAVFDLLAGTVADGEIIVMGINCSPHDTHTSMGQRSNFRSSIDLDSNIRFNSFRVGPEKPEPF
jgi:hypothetical protein